MALFKKRKAGNIRHRVFGDDDEEADGTGTNDNDAIELTLAKKEKKKEKLKKQSVLSFGDELEADDGISFQEKKSSLSNRIRKEMKKERKEKKKEEKDKLKQSEDKGQSQKVSELEELGIKIVNGREAEAIAMQPGDSDDDEDIYNGHGNIAFHPVKKPAVTLDPLKKFIQSGQIPDANMIHLIRKQRQQARDKGDFVPLDDTVRYEDSAGRLVRDDDNDRSDEEEERLDFSVNQQARDRQQRREAFNAAQEHDSEESEHEKEWEKQQLKKAGAASKLVSVVEEESLRDFSCAIPYPAQMPPSLPVANTACPQSGDTTWDITEHFVSLSSSSSLPRPSNYKAEGIIKRLRESRASLDEVTRRHKMESDSIIDDLVSAKATIKKCTMDQPPLIDDFQFYQDMRGYVTDLRDCLNEKTLEISKLEQQVYLLYRQRSQRLIQRRRQDVKDQNDEFSPFSIGKATETDKFRIRRAAEREGRRTRRRRERERKGDSRHNDGTSTDNEEPILEAQKLETELDKIKGESLHIFDDVEDEFAQLKSVMAKFEAWRTNYSSSYNDAYVSHNLAKLFSPYLRLQLLLWNPLMKENESYDVERMNWYNALMLYGASVENLTTGQLKDDVDRKLLSHLMEKVVLVKLKEIVLCYWDPLSHVQTVRLVNLVRHYTESYPTLSPSSKPLRELMEAVISKIRDAINNDIFIPMFPKGIYENKTSGVTLFFQRQFWVAWKLLSGILMWHNVFSDSVINDLAIRSLLNLYLIPALNLASEVNLQDSLNKCRNVIGALPRSWAKNGETHAFLGRLETFLVTLATKLDPSANSMEMKDICEFLRSIGAKQQAVILANKYL